MGASRPRSYATRGRTVLFTDGSERSNVFDRRLSGGKKPEAHLHIRRGHTRGQPSRTGNGELLSTPGTEEMRTGALGAGREQQEIARTTRTAPGVLGEAAARNESRRRRLEDGI
ncbi:hypothetical protein GCM10023238_09090 [Streptomyces heliomycini]